MPSSVPILSKRLRTCMRRCAVNQCFWVQIHLASLFRVLRMSGQVIISSNCQQGECSSAEVGVVLLVLKDVLFLSLLLRSVLLSVTFFLFFGLCCDRAFRALHPQPFASSGFSLRFCSSFHAWFRRMFPKTLCKDFHMSLTSCRICGSVLVNILLVLLGTRLQ